MLRHLPVHEFQSILVIGTFVLTLTVFLFFFVRALRMKKKDADHLSQLPLEDDSKPDSRHE
jgi:hypothetical protein